MKRPLLVLILLFSAFGAFSAHIKGGFFTYTYLGPGLNDPTKLRYSVKLTVYMECVPPPSSGQLTNPITFTFFNATTNAQVANPNVSIAREYTVSKDIDDECISGDQRGCYYYIVEYELPSIELTPLPGGYIVSYQRCCRIGNIMNITNSASVGNTYSVKIPGTAGLNHPEENSSPQFQVNDNIVICGGSYFEFPFTATDPDADSLSYYFCDAWSGGGQGSSGTGPGTAAPNPAAAPTSTNPLQYPVVNYTSPYNGSSPLGSGVTIDPRTGLIKGIAPGNTSGQPKEEFVVTVCVDEWREGVKISSSRKELHIRVGTCSPIQATLDPEWITCDGFTQSFFNQTNNGILSYYWDFGVAGQTNDTSNLATPTFTYADTGVYVLRLIVNKGTPCAGEDSAIVKVFPGFFPGFTHSGICVDKPTQFQDTTNTRYGVVDTWKWDFGDVNSTTDNSTLQNPAYTYNQVGTKNVRFIVTNSKGCIDTVFKDILIVDKPPIDVGFSDTLICRGDQVQLEAIGNGAFSWTPGTNITNPNTATPTVSPPATTDYTVTLNDNGCLNTATVKVRVVNFVTLNVMPDTTICATDTIRLRASGDGLQYAWSPAPTIFNPNISNPLALPVTTTTYQVTSTIGGCNTSDNVTVTLVPYPFANAGPDTTICFNTIAQLHGQITGNGFAWSPSGSLSDPTSLTPVATPNSTTSYVLSVTDNIGCPKPGRDTVIVTVLPKMMPSAGRDTAVVVGQPLQLQATGGDEYLWTPATGLNNPNSDAPIGKYDGSFEYITYLVRMQNAAGCEDTASVTVRVFKTNPQIFVPSAFTPNGDGRNDRFNFVAVGISKIEYFRVYNRWGQLVYSSGINSYGWDGRIGGKEQGSGTFVWIVQGSDFTGKTVTAKGTVTLIR